MTYIGDSSHKFPYEGRVYFNSKVGMRNKVNNNTIIAIHSIHTVVWNTKNPVEKLFHVL